MTNENATDLQNVSWRMEDVRAYQHPHSRLILFSLNSGMISFDHKETENCLRISGRYFFRTVGSQPLEY